MTAEQLQEPFAGTRQALSGYWQAKGSCKEPKAKIRRHLRKMGVSGFFREMLWHLLSAEEYKRLVKLRQQRALRLWDW
jgi:hypothetical protein